MQLRLMLDGERREVCVVVPERRTSIEEPGVPTVLWVRGLTRIRPSSPLSPSPSQKPCTQDRQGDHPNQHNVGQKQSRQAFHLTPPPTCLGTTLTPHTTRFAAREFCPPTTPTPRQSPDYPTPPDPLLSPWHFRLELRPSRRSPITGSRQCAPPPRAPTSCARSSSRRR